MGKETVVTIPEGITVGNSAFRDSNITKLIVPDSIKNFDAQSVLGCRSLQFNIFDTGKYLGSEKNPYRFLIGPIDYNVASCEIHENAECVCNFAFFDCKHLENVTGGRETVVKK